MTERRDEDVRDSLSKVPCSHSDARSDRPVRPSGYSALLLGTEGQLLSTKKLSATKESKGDSAKLARGRHSMAPFADRAPTLSLFLQEVPDNVVIG